MTAALAATAQLLKVWPQRVGAACPGVPSRTLIRAGTRQSQPVARAQGSIALNLHFEGGICVQRLKASRWLIRAQAWVKTRKMSFVQVCASARAPRLARRRHGPTFTKIKLFLRKHPKVEALASIPLALVLLILA